VDLPLRRALSAGTEPNDLKPSCFMGGAGAGEEEMGAETSSMEPKVTADACLTAGTLLREMLTPSFMGTPWPSALGRREWVRLGSAGWAGDCERGVGAALFWGGLFAQADRGGSCVIFGADAVEDLLILRGGRGVA
jgi:hypothetical protein